MGNGRFTDGLIFGALLGGAAVFLLGTKKGNKVLKVLTEEGMAGLSEIFEELEGAHNGVNPGPKQAKVDIDDDFEEIVVETPTINGTSGASKSKSTKRFFRKAK